jgi:hypothetical protein
MKSARTIYETLVTLAQCRLSMGYPDPMRLAHAERDSKPIPECCKPGYLLSTLSPEERAELANLSSEQLSKYRLD